MKKYAPLLPITVPAPRRFFGGDKKPARKRDRKKSSTKPAAGKDGDEPPASSEPLAETIQPAIPEHREDIQAPHTFSREETAAMNAGLLQALNDVELLQSQKKAAVQDFGLRIQNRTNEAKMLRTKLAAGEETRPLRAAVAFDAKRGMKQYIHPETGAHIREEPMQPADWQLPMFRPAEDGSEKPAARGESDVAENKAGKSKAPKSSPVGETNVGDALDAAAAKTRAPQFLLDLTAEDWESAGLMRAFKKAAKAAGWTAPQVSALADILSACDTVEAMLDTLRPYTIAPGSTPNPGDLPSVEVTLEQGFTADRIIQQFRAGAMAAGWPNADTDRVCGLAKAAADMVQDEPEASEEATKVFAPYIATPGEDQLPE